MKEALDLIAIGDEGALPVVPAPTLSLQRKPADDKSRFEV
jgi:hypothetical protein